MRPWASAPRTLFAPGYSAARVTAPRLHPNLRRKHFARSSNRRSDTSNRQPATQLSKSTRAFVSIAAASRPQRALALHDAEPTSALEPCDPRGVVFRSKPQCPFASEVFSYAAATTAPRGALAAPARLKLLPPAPRERHRLRSLETSSAGEERNALWLAHRGVPGKRPRAASSPERADARQSLARTLTLQPQPKRWRPNKTTLTDGNAIDPKLEHAHECWPPRLRRAFHTTKFALDARGRKCRSPGRYREVPTSDQFDDRLSGAQGATANSTIEPDTLVTSTSSAATGARQSGSRACLRPA